MQRMHPAKFPASLELYRDHPGRTRAHAFRQRSFAASSHLQLVSALTSSELANQPCTCRRRSIFAGHPAVADEIPRQKLAVEQTCIGFNKSADRGDAALDPCVAGGLPARSSALLYIPAVYSRAFHRAAKSTTSVSSVRRLAFFSTNSRMRAPGFTVVKCRHFFARRRVRADPAQQRGVGPILYQPAETLTHARTFRCLSKIAISHWTAGRFCQWLSRWWRVA